MKCQKLLIVAALLVIGNHASAQTPTALVITVDENGHGTLAFPFGEYQLNFSFAADPGPGGLPSVLTYDLGGMPPLAAGDVLLTDNGIVFDVLRFNAADPTTGYPASIVFYSDSVDGADSLADTNSPPTQFYTNVVSIPEVGTESNNGAVYIPGPNDPGFVAGFAVTYHFISDAVPEPGTLALVFGAASLPLLAMRRKRSHR